MKFCAKINTINWYNLKVDARLRELERQCRLEDRHACHACFMLYRRLDTRTEHIPPQVLYLGTEVEIAQQPELDFRSVLQRGSRGRPSNFNGIYFNENVSISIQASEGHYCNPKITTDKWNYQSWELMFDRPTYRKVFWEPLDEEDEAEIARLSQDPATEIDDRDGDVEVVTHNPQFSYGGKYYGFPHQNHFSRYDEVMGWVPTEDVQDMFDFLRARFGLAH
jgi:hypothetical protein